MINIKKIAVAALILLLIGVAGSLLTFKSMNKSEQVSEEKVINNDRYTNINITTDNAKIELIPTNDAATKVELSGKVAKQNKYTFVAEADSNTLNIQLKERQKKLFNFDFFSTSYLIKVYVPEKLYDTVQIESDNGRVKVANLQAKDINVETDNGRIELNNVQGTSVTAEANNGRIELKGVDASTVMVKADNGKIHLADVEGNISGKTDNGSISLITTHLDRHIDFETDNGSIKIQTEKEPANATFDVRVDNGRVSIFGNSIRNTVIGNGDHLIKLTTNNGSITVTKETE